MMRVHHTARISLPVLLVAAVRLSRGDGPVHVLIDANGDSDAVARRTDPGANGLFDPIAHHLPDVREIHAGAWAPNDPAVDLFAGNFAASGGFVRLDLLLNGLMNPPGPALPYNFHPFVYGDHPVYGFVEIDMDHDVSTGGELLYPQYRYLTNVARFGGKPSRPEFGDRVALSAVDTNFSTPPFVERHGEEFHLALLGELIENIDIVPIAGNGNLLFEAGETWNIHARLFHRAHGYAGYAFGGEYEPDCTLQFRHDIWTDITWVSLVFPLTNAAAASMTGVPPQENNNFATDQASVLEALSVLHETAEWLVSYPSGNPTEAIIDNWRFHDPAACLDPTLWDLTVLLGSSYTQPEGGEYFIWTDVYPNPVRGDMDGNDLSNAVDRQLIEDYIAAADAADGVLDGVVTIPYFAGDFSVYDINHNGVVDAIDALLVGLPLDFDGDGDMDLADFGRFAVCFSGGGTPLQPATCAVGDLDTDGDVDLLDIRRIEELLTGPQD